MSEFPRIDNSMDDIRRQEAKDDSLLLDLLAEYTEKVRRSSLRISEIKTKVLIVEFILIACIPIVIMLSSISSNYISKNNLDYTFSVFTSFIVLFIAIVGATVLVFRYFTERRREEEALKIASSALDKLFSRTVKLEENKSLSFMDSIALDLRLNEARAVLHMAGKHLTKHASPAE